jgi:hypothetical protein
MKRYLERIQRCFPGLRIDQAEENSNGLMDDVLVVNQERVFRFAEDEAWIRECLRARFMSFLSEPSWVLRGLRSRDPSWFTVSLGTARDMRPVGSGWE